MERGWVRLWRKVLDSDVFAHEGLLKVFIWCLLKANRRAASVPVRTGRGETVVHLQAGQFIFGRKKAAKALLMPPTTVEDRVKRLVDIGVLGRQPHTHFSILSVCNWSDYQSSPVNSDESGTQPAPNRHPTGTDKNKQNEQKNVLRVPCGTLVKLWNAFAAECDLPKVKKLNEKRKRKVRLRWREWSQDGDALEVFKQLCDEVRQSRFLKGETERWRGLTFWWLVENSNNWLKVLEGNYRDGSDRDWADEYDK